MSRIKDLAFIYQSTGVWTDEMEQLETKYIDDNFEGIQDKYINYINKNLDETIDFETFLSLEIGMWEYHNGFTIGLEFVWPQYKNIRYYI